tara:strand:- start:2850 stop:3971 length:1122 start_codon:yes stop_codon:yes gene_type:complete
MSTIYTKELIDKMYENASSEGHNIPRKTSYEDIIKNIEEKALKGNHESIDDFLDRFSTDCNAKSSLLVISTFDDFYESFLKGNNDLDLAEQIASGDLRAIDQNSYDKNPNGSPNYFGENSLFEAFLNNDLIKEGSARFKVSLLETHANEVPYASIGVLFEDKSDRGFPFSQCIATVHFMDFKNAQRGYLQLIKKAKQLPEDIQQDFAVLELLNHSNNTISHNTSSDDFENALKQMDRGNIQKNDFIRNIINAIENTTSYDLDSIESPEIKREVGNSLIGFNQPGTNNTTLKTLTYSAKVSGKPYAILDEEGMLFRDFDDKPTTKFSQIRFLDEKEASSYSGDGIIVDADKFLSNPKYKSEEQKLKTSQKPKHS